MKLSLLILFILLTPLIAYGQARTTDRVISVPHSQLALETTAPNGSVRHVINGLEGTTPCTAGGNGALAIRINGVWQCPKLTPGIGTGDMLGPSASSVGELVVFSSTSGKNAGRSNTLSGIPFLISGVVSTLTSTGSGGVVRDTSPTVATPTLLTPVIASFTNAQHTHEAGASGGQLNASTVFSSGTIPTARVVSGTIVNQRCLRVNNVGVIEVAAGDCGTGGGGGSPGGVSGNLIFNESGAFGGLSNTTYDSASGRLTLAQKIDGNDTLNLQRATDTSPTGTLLRARNAANTTDLFSVSATGGVFASSTITVLNTAAPATPSAGNTILWTDSTGKNLRAQDDAGNVSGTVRAITCSGTDKISSISSAGVPVCTADQGGSGTGVITLNTLVTSDQTFADVDDTNVTLTIGSSVSTHTFTIGWTGTLAKARQHAATVYSDQANTWTTGAQSFAAVASLTVPSATGATPSASGLIAYDLTSHTLEYGENGTNRLVANTAGSQTFSNKTLDNSTTANLRDTLLTLQDNTDSTKTVNFELSAVASGVNRVVSIPNANTTTVQPTTATSNQFVTHIDASGVVQKAQPSFANLSGSMGPTQGGTGLTAVAQGDLLYGDAINSWARLAKSTAATRYLSNTGASNNPAWAQVDLTNGVTGALPFASLSGVPDAVADGVTKGIASFTAADFNSTSGNISIDYTNAQAASGSTKGFLTAADWTTFNSKVSASAQTTFTSTSVPQVTISSVTTNTGLDITRTGGATLRLNTDGFGTDVPGIYTTGAHSLGLGYNSTIKLALNNDGAVIVGLVELGEITVPTNPAVNKLRLYAKDTGGLTRLFYVDSAGTEISLSGAGSGDMVLASAQTVSGAKTFDPAKLIVGNVSAAPTPVLGAVYVDTDDGKLYYGINGTTWGEVFVSGLSVVNLASANVTGTLPLANGGTNQTSWTAARCVRVNAGGTALEAAAADCGSGGGSGDVVGPASATDNAVVRFDSTTGKLVQNSAVTIADTTGDISSPGALILTGSGAGYLELAEGTAPSAVGNRVTVSAPTDVQTAGWVLSLPPTPGTSGQFLQTNGSGVTIWASPAGSGTVTATGGDLTANSVVLGAGSTDTKVVAGIITDGTSKLTLGVAGTSVGSIDLKNATSGTITLAPVTGALGAVTLSLPARTATIATTTGTLTSGRCVEIDANGNFIQAAAACGSGGGSGTVSTATINQIAYYTGTTTVGGDAGIIYDSTTDTLSVGGPANFGSINTSGAITLTGSGAGYLEMAEGTAPTLVANRFQVFAPADVAAGGLSFILPGAAATGFLKTTNSSGAMTLSIDTATYETAASTATFTNKTYDTSATGNVFTSEHKVFLPAAGCQNTAAASFWDLPTTTPAVAACVTGTNTQKGVLDFADTTGGFSAQTTLQLPSDFTGTIDARISWTTTATSGNVEWSLSTICTAVDATETDDPAFNTPSTVVTAAPGVASRVQTSSITSVTITGCAANELMHVRIFRDGNDAQDTIAATARLIGIELTIRRAQ